MVVHAPYGLTVLAPFGAVSSSEELLEELAAYGSRCAAQLLGAAEFTAAQKLFGFCLELLKGLKRETTRPARYARHDASDY